MIVALRKAHPDDLKTAVVKQGLVYNCKKTFRYVPNSNRTHFMAIKCRVFLHEI